MERLIDNQLSSNDLGNVEWSIKDKNCISMLFKCNFNIMEHNSKGKVEQSLIIYMDPDHHEID